MARLRSVAERLLGSESVRIDGRPEGKSHRLAGGEEVEFEPPETERPSLAPEPMDLRIAYEDEHLVVVDKPAGLVVHPGHVILPSPLTHPVQLYDHFIRYHSETRREAA